MNTQFVPQNPYMSGISLDDLQKQMDTILAFIEQFQTQEDSSVAQEIATTWIKYLESESQAIFFQGFSEVISFKRLYQQGWNVAHIGEKDELFISSPSGVVHRLITVALAHKRNFEQEAASKTELINNLNRIDSPYRIGVILREPLYDRHNWIELCTALEKWFQYPQTQLHSFAYFRKNDPNIMLEFGVSKEKSFLKDVVHFCMNPVEAWDSWEQTRQTVLNKMDSQTTEKPIILSIVNNSNANQSRNFLCSRLYGPIASVCGSRETRQYSFDNSLIPGIFEEFEEISNTNVQGIMNLSPQEDHNFGGEIFLSPHSVLTDIPTPFFGPMEDKSIFQWTES